MGSDDYTVVDVSSIDDALITDVAFSEVEHPLKPEVFDSKAKPRQSIELPRAEPTVAGSARVVTVTNQKGGVGKATSVINIAAHVAMRGGRVLVVDCDAQGNCASGLGIDKSRVNITTRDVVFSCDGDASAPCDCC